MAISPLTNSFSRTLFSFIPTTSPRPTKKSLKGPVIQYSMRLFLTCCIRDRVDDRVLKEMIRKIPNTKVLSVEHADINAVTRKEIHKTARMIRRAEDHILYEYSQCLAVNVHEIIFIIWALLRLIELKTCYCKNRTVFHCNAL
uniref:Uncharacterized protein n=1 Tax=Rhizophagus irregularis (strain DAOM 181602 / DAOM 197198 / MUCL 43194) TaxID=747089 RepID=U9UQT3_RHIID